MAVNASLRSFDLAECGFGPNTAAAMGDALMMSPTIVKLNLAHNPFGASGASTLIKSASLAAQIQAEKNKVAKAEFVQAEKEKQIQMAKNGKKTIRMTAVAVAAVNQTKVTKENRNTA